MMRLNQALLTFASVAMLAIPQYGALAQTSSPRPGAPAERANPALSAPASLIGTCNIPRARVRTVTTSVSTSSTTRTIIPDSTLSFNKTNSPGCVIVRFSAESRAFGGNGNSILIHSVLENVASGAKKIGHPGPPDVLWNQEWVEVGTTRVHSFEWVFYNVPVGAHNVWLTWASASGDPVSLWFRTLTVLHQ
jgi:hypothetical protein